MTIREEAILLLDIEASSPGVGCTVVAESIGASKAAEDLASDAWWSCFETPFKLAQLRAAEAAAKLREGWKPKRENND